MSRRGSLARHARAEQLDREVRRAFSETEPEMVGALAALLLRFHGRRVDVASPELEPWRALEARLQAAATETEAPPKRAWEGVCVALITHPDFYTY